jgi:hypothetical protein
VRRRGVGAAASRHVLAALVGADETDPGTMDWSAEATTPVWSEEKANLPAPVLHGAGRHDRDPDRENSPPASPSP